MKLLSKNERERPGMKEIFTDKFIQKTIEEFIHSDGQYMIMTKIPIKKTALHHELKKEKKDIEENKKNIDEQMHTNNELADYDKTVVSLGGSQTMQKTTMSTDLSMNTQKQIEIEETPQQRMQRKKMEALKQKEEKMKEAARQALETRDQAKMRKNLELHGSMVADQNQTLSKSRDFIGDTLKSEYFEGTNMKNPSLVSNLSAFEKKPTAHNDTIRVYISLAQTNFFLISHWYSK